MAGGASMNDIKNRIKSVESTMQITKAMELVATSKLRRAKELAERSKPYLEALLAEMKKLGGEVLERPNAKDGKVLYVVVAGDRGLAGGYNSNVFKLLASTHKEGDGVYIPVGKKAHEYIARHSLEVFSSELYEADGARVGKCIKIGEMLSEAYISGEISEMYIVYTEFRSMLTQVPVAIKMLPIDTTEEDSDPICEDSPEQILNGILPQYIGGSIYAAISESVASECAARRTAMNSANKNAEEMISSLTLSFNRARQAAITQEITEIVSGAEAL